MSCQRRRSKGCSNGLTSSRTVQDVPVRSRRSLKRSTLPQRQPDSPSSLCSPLPALAHSVISHVLCCTRQVDFELSQQQAKERQRRVLAQMSVTGATTATNPVALAAAAAEKLKLKREGVSAPQSDESTASIQPELQLRAAKAEREVNELMDEVQGMRTHHREREEGMLETIEKERKEHRRVRDELDSVFVQAGIHEAQEMAQMRIEIRALTEDNEFLTSREAKVHEEENRLQVRLVWERGQHIRSVRKR